MYRDFIFIFSEGTSITFEAVVNKYTASLTAFAFGLTNEMEGAKDAVQEAFMNLWSHKPAFNDEEHLKRSLYISVRNRVLNSLRSSVRHKRYLSTSPDDEFMPDPVLAMIRQESIRLMFEAIDALPLRTAEVLRFTVQGYRLEEIANQMGIAVSSVKTMKKNGIDKIRERYKRITK